jgi:ribosomal protein L22
LDYMPKKAAKSLAKVIRSAAANAVTNGKKSL